jgi:hypothetical protein
VALYFHSPNTPSWRGAQLKHRDNFTFYVHWFHLGYLFLCSRIYLITFLSFM